MFTVKEIRQKYLDFFKSKGHVVIPGASLLPENDPSVLFTTAGMHPLVPFLLGETHPAGTRLTDYQKCLRTGDIDEVGDNSHLTFFEMMGNWSLGDYWKEESLNWSWEFLTDSKWLGLDKNKFAVTVFAGTEKVGADEVSFEIWKKIGVAEERIAKLGVEDNWWPAGGKSTGPQGPCSEIFYWTGENEVPDVFDPADNLWVEIWNNVFMEFNKDENGNLLPLKRKNVDTGFGLERAGFVLQGKTSVYETDDFLPLMSLVKAQATNYQEKSGRIIVDHLRSASFVLADNVGIVPSNVDQGYVARKLIRRVIIHAKKIGLHNLESFFTEFINILIERFAEVHSEIKNNSAVVIKELLKENELFAKTLENGLKEFNRLSIDGQISAQDAFKLYTTYGFPLEMTKELASEQGRTVDEGGFDQAMLEHQKLSQTGAAGKFKGGLIDHSEQVVKYHTATHLLHQALKIVLGDHVAQKGSNITEERLRFDFVHSEKMTPEQLKQVEDMVNEKILAKLPVNCEESTVDEAKAKGAIGLFADKYGDKVKVYTVGDFSKEICGGPHVQNTSELGHFKITKEEASSAGIRRIKAVLEN
jgi:alanyl-tRNA synthetase